jgi:hypothetical protein
MAYVHTNGVDPTKPAGNDPANVDDDMRDIKLAYNERFDDFFGTNWATDDPIAPTKIGPTISVSSGQVYTAVYNAGNSGTTLAIDFDDGDQQKITLTGNCTLSFTNIRAGASYILYIVQDGTGGRSITFPSSVRQSGGVNLGTPSLTTTANRLSIVSLTAYSATILFGNVVGTGINVS